MLEELLRQLGLENTPENVAIAQAFLDKQIEGLKNKNNELINKNKKFKQYENLDIEKLLEQQKDNEVNEYLEHIKKGQGAEYLQQIKAAVRQEVEAEYKETFSAKENAIKEWQDKFTSLQTQNDQALIKEHLRSELSKATGINKQYLDTIVHFAMNEIEIEEADGVRKAAYKNRNVKNKNGENKSIVDWFSEKTEDPSFGYFLEANGGTGGAGGQSKGSETALEDMSGDDLMSELGL